MSTLPDFVPVPRRQRVDGWSPARQAGFLQALEVTGSVAAAAESVGMNEGSAYRLRRHPDAEGFRQAWATATARTWQRVEQVALERVIHGDIEVIEREGQVVATRRRPCSDRLMIHMLQQQVRRLELEAAARDAAIAAAAAAARWKPEAERPAPPLDAAAAETRVLRELQDCIGALPDSHGWDARVLATTTDHDGPVPPQLSPPKTLAPANVRLDARSRPARMRDDAAPRKARKTLHVAGFSPRQPDESPAFVPHPYPCNPEIGGGAWGYGGPPLPD